MTRSAQQSLIVGGALALVLLGVRPAHADFGEPSFGEGTAGVPGTPSFEALQEVANTNAMLFGAVGMFDRHIVPRLVAARKHETEGLVLTLALEQTMGINVGRILGTCDPEEARIDCDSEHMLFNANAYNTGGAIYGGTTNFGAFASWSYNVTYVAGTPATGVAGAAYGLGGLFLAMGGRENFEKAAAGSIDLVAGVHGGYGPVNVELGYVYSQGLFSNVQAPNICAFATAALNDAFSQLALARAGCRQLAWTKDEDKNEEVGTSSLYAQRLLLGAVTRNAPSVADFVGDAREQARIAMNSLHLAHEKIARVVDLGVAFAREVKSRVHDAHLSLNYPGDDGIIEGTMGMIQMPAMWHHGYDGQPRFHFEFKMGLSFPNYGDDRPPGYVVLFARRNSPELISAFPQSQATFLGFEAVIHK